MTGVLLTSTGCGKDANVTEEANTAQQVNTEEVTEGTDTIEAASAGEIIDFDADHGPAGSGEYVADYKQIPLSAFNSIEVAAMERINIWAERGCHCNETGIIPLESYHNWAESNVEVGLTMGTNLNMAEGYHNCLAVIIEMQYVYEDDNVTTYVPLMTYDVTDEDKIYSECTFENQDQYVLVNGHKYWGFESIDAINEYLKDLWGTTDISYVGK